jgi:hypothetical protein
MKVSGHKMATRATAEEFQAWKEACIADPSKLDGMSKELQKYWMNEFGIVLPGKANERITSAISENLMQGLRIKLTLRDDATFEEIALFAYQITSLMPVIPTKEFQALLFTAGDALAHLGATWSDVFTYLKAGAA